MPETKESRGNPDQLTGWKDIAAYLGKSVRTVQRWERHAGLPVHRVQPLGEVVYAFRSEIDAWRRTPAGSQALGAGGSAEPSAPAPSQPPAPAREALGEPTGGPAASAPPPPVRRTRRPILIGLATCAVLLVLVGLLWTVEHRTLALSASPSEPQVQGQHFQLLVTGADHGTALMRWTRLPNGRQESMPPALRADESGSMRWGFSTDCRTETGTHEVWVQDEASGERSDVMPVIVLPNPECLRPMPDLAARVETLDRTSVDAGGGLTLRFTIWNMGNADAVATLTRVRLGIHSTRTGISDPRLADVPMPPLPVGQSSTQTVTVAIPAETKPGVYYVWIVADNASATIEPNSFNNFARSEAFVVGSGQR